MSDVADVNKAHQPRYGWVDGEWISREQAVGGAVALGQIWMDGAWLDYARGTPSQAIDWASDRPAGTARVVDWIDKGTVIWPRPLDDTIREMTIVSIHNNLSQGIEPMPMYDDDAATVVLYRTEVARWRKDNPEATLDTADD